MGFSPGQREWVHLFACERTPLSSIDGHNTRFEVACCWSRDKVVGDVMQCGGFEDNHSRLEVTRGERPLWARSSRSLGSALNGGRNGHFADILAVQKPVRS